MDILRKCEVESPIGDLMNIAERADRTKFRNQVLSLLLADGLLEMTIPELHFHAKIMAAVSRGIIDDVLSLGTNAAQAAAQPLRASGRAVACSRKGLGEAEQQALAIFLLNGVRVTGLPPAQTNSSELLRFAAEGVDGALMKSTNAFIREIACLHGLSTQPRHPTLLEAVFDQDEELAMDAIDQLQQSVSP